MNSAYEWVNKRTKPAKPNNKTMDYRVKTDKFEGIEKGTEVISSIEVQGIAYFPGDNKWYANEHYINAHKEYFEPVEEVQEGQYWEWQEENYKFRIQDVNDGMADYKYLDNNGVLSVRKNYLIDNARKLSTDEIGQALVKEAKRRGLVAGESVNNENLGYCFEGEISNPDFGFDYHDGIDRLSSGNAFVYKKGEWAEKIDQTPTIEINGNKVEFNDHPKVGCTTIKKEVFIEQAKTIARHGVRIHRKGEDITDQILAIASHYGYEDEIKYRAGDTIIMGTLEDVTFSDQNMWRNND